MRTIIDIPEEDVRLLDVIAKKTRRSRAEIIRGCIRHYLDMAGDMKGISHDIFGAFDDVFTEDGVTMQQAMRERWNDREEYAKILHDRKKKD